ncbi:hypothetical protein C8J57DRAFT_1729030 [Mycena rebaudengoi]|nr:hypothetical protein C8J57DRAFT_1729030 [Mycena rebaudengoi]
MISFLLAPMFWLIPAQLGVDAQVVSPTWRKPNITASTANRIRIVSAALEQSLNHLGVDGQFTDSEDGGWGRAGQFYGQMADFDVSTGQSKYEDTIQKNLAFTQRTGANFSDEKYYGRAAAKAYSAYGTQIFLDYAIQAWWFGRRYTLTLDNVNSGKTNVKNYPIIKTCDSDASPTANFLILSALLAEATSDPMYLQAASDAADFIRAHLYTGSHLIQNPDFSGLVIEGLSILFSITKKASTQLLLNDLITVIPHTTWQQLNGILINDQDFFPGTLVKGLAVAYARNATNPELRDWMKAYIAVQFNALVDLATNGTNIYAKAWEGPPSLTFDGGAQSDAIEVLLSAISFEDDSQPASSTNGSPSPTGAGLPPPSPPSGSGKSSMTGTIVGGIIGSIALLSCIGFVFWMARRRQLRGTGGLGALPTATVAPIVFAPYAERSVSEPLTVLAPQRAKPNDDNFSLLPTSGSVEDQLDGAALGGQAEYSWNTHPWRPTSEAQVVEIPTAQLIALLHERLQNEVNQGQPPDYPPSSQLKRISDFRPRTDDFLADVMF